MMGCSSCGGKKAQEASVAKPYEVELPDGTKKTVSGKAEERVEMDKAWARMRLKNGYRVKR